MRLSEKWYDQVCEDYFLYLDSVNEDTIPMDYQSFEWLKIREAGEELAEAQELSLH